MDNTWRDYLPELANKVDHMADDIACQLFDESSIINMPANSTVFLQGDVCKNYLIVLSGKVKVFTRAENGREILLYRLANGDSCVLTTSCLFGNKSYPAEGQTESNVIAMAIPASKFNQAIQLSATFREQVFSAFSSHLSELITLVEEVAFGKLDTRLAKYLLEHSQNGNVITATHQGIATELGTAREVISRQLKDMEAKGYLALNRGSISVINNHALEAMTNDKQV